RDGGVLIDVVLDDVPAHLRREPPAVTDLVVEGGRALHLGAEARVDGAALHEVDGSRTGPTPTTRGACWSRAARASKPATKSSQARVDGVRSEEGGVGDAERSAPRVLELRAFGWGAPSRGAITGPRDRQDRDDQGQRPRACPRSVLRALLHPR